MACLFFWKGYYVAKADFDLTRQMRLAWNAYLYHWHAGIPGVHQQLHLTWNGVFIDLFVYVCEITEGC